MMRTGCARLLLAAAATLALASAMPAIAQAVSSAQAIAWLNAQRTANGIPGAITENTTWDTGCAHHVAWEQLNNLMGHYEGSGTPGYTDDGALAGRSSVLAATTWSVSGRYPWGAESPWETAPIHLMQLLGPNLQSTGWGESTGWGYGAYTCMTTWPGYGPAPASITPQLLTYPGDGTSFIYASETAAELPFTPGEFVGLPESTTTGPYLYVFAYGIPSVPGGGNIIGAGRITAASLIGPSGPVAVATVDNDTQNAELGSLGGYIPPGGMIIPIMPLMPGASYTASVTFQPDPENLPPEVPQPPQTPLSKTWSFSTAPALAVPPTPNPPAQLNDTFDRSGLSVSSDSPAPITVVIKRLPSGTVVAKLTLNPGSSTRLNLPGASYQACFTQPASDRFAAPRPDCHRQTWASSPGLSLGRARRVHGRLLVALGADPKLAGARATMTLSAYVRLCRGGHCRSQRVSHRKSLTLSSQQTLKLRSLGADQGRLTVTIPACTRGDFRFLRGVVSETVGAGS